MISILIPGEPATITAQQKGVSFKARRFYTKTALKAEGRRIAKFASLSKPDAPLAGPLIVAVKIVHPLTQAQAEKHTARLSDPTFELRHDKRPDADNSLKLILDTLTRIGIWGDDGQISDVAVHKRYGSEPRIEIRILEAPPLP